MYLYIFKISFECLCVCDYIYDCRYLWNMENLEIWMIVRWLIWVLEIESGFFVIVLWIIFNFGVNYLGLVYNFLKCKIIKIFFLEIKLFIY